MKLALFGLAAVAHANISIEKGGTWGGVECKEATAWYHYKLGGSEPVTLTPTAADADAGSYTLKDNVIVITADSKKREMMGDVACSNEKELARVEVTGLPVFKNIANALTVLEKDQNKRIECEVSGYPIPTVTWKFQAVEKEMFDKQCPPSADGLPVSSCTYSCNENCDPTVTCDNDDHDVKENCIAEYYEKNSTDLFTVLGTHENMKTNIAVRYVNTAEKGENEPDGCPMDDTPPENSRCIKADNVSDVNGLKPSFKPKTQLFFTNVEYSQGGKYICVATQGKSDAKVTRTKPFIWRVKDPMAALWPFLALVLEVIVVVCIILYYERASKKKENAETPDEGDEFIEGKKDES